MIVGVEAEVGVEVETGVVVGLVVGGVVDGLGVEVQAARPIIAARATNTSRYFPNRSIVRMLLLPPYSMSPFVWCCY